jgi:hypothetical protein
MINTFNRELPNNKMFCVAHPWGKYKSTKGEDLRKIKKIQINLPRIAGYFSAYQVAEELIGLLEALIIRMVPNDLINARIEAKDMRAFPAAEI